MAYHFLRFAILHASRNAQHDHRRPNFLTCFAVLRLCMASQGSGISFATLDATVLTFGRGALHIQDMQTINDARRWNIGPAHPSLLFCRSWTWSSMPAAAFHGIELRLFPHVMFQLHMVSQ
jgi:hypothetical protein